MNRTRPISRHPIRGWRRLRRWGARERWRIPAWWLRIEMSGLRHLTMMAKATRRRSRGRLIGIEVSCSYESTKVENSHRMMYISTSGDVKMTHVAETRSPFPDAGQLQTFAGEPDRARLTAPAVKA